MKYTKTTFAIFIIILFIISISCKKGFLNVTNSSFPLRQEYVVDLVSCEHYMNGVYVELSGNFYKGYAYLYPELIADNIKPVGNALSYHYTWSQQKNDERSATGLSDAMALNMNSVWFTGYRIIRDCNFILETIDKYRNENPLKSDDLKGQAYAIRALVHSVLANVFAQSVSFSSDGYHAGIPYVTQSDWNIQVPRKSISEVYDQIVADLLLSIQLLSKNYNNSTVINRGAVKGLLSRIYLFKGSYIEAKNMAREVASAHPITEIADGYPNNLFSLLPLNQTESLFQLSPARNGVAGNTFSTTFCGVYFAAPVMQFSATADITSILKEDLNDIRRFWVRSGNRDTIYKYPRNIVPGFPTPTLSYYQTLIRSSEMYLTAAESYVQLNNEDSARYYLDLIRKRANPLAISTTATGSALLDTIYKERRRELAFEGMRMYDLLRLKRSVQRVDAAVPSNKVLPYPSDKAIAPIPQMDASLSGIGQNPGY